MEEGIPVVKIPENLYEKHTKWLWYPGIIKDAIVSVFTEDIQIKRMEYIVIDHIVYNNISEEVRNYWRQHVTVLMDVCNDLANHLQYNQTKEMMYIHHLK